MRLASAIWLVEASACVPLSLPEVHVPAAAVGTIVDEVRLGDVIPVDVRVEKWPGKKRHLRQDLAKLNLDLPWFRHEYPWDAPEVTVDWSSRTVEFPGEMLVRLPEWRRQDVMAYAWGVRRAYRIAAVPYLSPVGEHDVLLMSTADQVAVRVVAHTEPEGVFFVPAEGKFVVRSRAVRDALPNAARAEFALVRDGDRILLYGEVVVSIAEVVWQDGPQRDFARHEIAWTPVSVTTLPTEAAVAVGYEAGWNQTGSFTVYRAYWDAPTDRPSDDATTVEQTTPDAPATNPPSP